MLNSLQHELMMETVNVALNRNSNICGLRRVFMSSSADSGACPPLNKSLHLAGSGVSSTSAGDPALQIRTCSDLCLQVELWDQRTLTPGTSLSK
ncbi:hypothetical protein CgunFtcFv8_023960 [Champsocephalus gunnari]|uniref:Uncharacterized protein n=1 Tax=Champsocephalus gunnari TaxID=52237 RepID=A0AAN8DDD8_CHAGU|nr:hypothetical protein CgunFtcFv8_023960 [Champsocephalus gunnari]